GNRRLGGGCGLGRRREEILRRFRLERSKQEGCDQGERGFRQGSYHSPKSSHSAKMEGGNQSLRIGLEWTLVSGTAGPWSILDNVAADMAGLRGTVKAAGTGRKLPSAAPATGKSSGRSWRAGCVNRGIRSGAMSLSSATGSELVNPYFPASSPGT